jgi:hypothetical protein
VATAVSAATAIGTGIAGHQESAKQAQAQRVAANKAVTAVPTTTSPEVQDMAAQARRRAALARGQSSTNIVGQSGLGGGSKLGNVGIG